MDQCVIETLKRLCTKQLLRQLLLCNDDEENVLHFCKGLDLKECSYMLADAWNDVKTNTLNKAVGKSFQKLNEDV
jgi:hypothetical protein